MRVLITQCGRMVGEERYAPVEQGLDLSVEPIQDRLELTFPSELNRIPTLKEIKLLQERLTNLLDHIICIGTGCITSLNIDLFNCVPKNHSISFLTYALP